MKKWFTKAYWTQHDIPGLVVVMYVILLVAIIFLAPRIIEYLTRP
jgi:hypothetical protein